MKRRILFAMVEAGNGHKAPAMALKEGFEQLYPGEYDIDVLDICVATGDNFLDWQHKNGWNWLLRHPRITYYGQRVIDNAIPTFVTRYIQGVVLHKHTRNASRFVSECDYDLLVATHFYPLQALSNAKKRHGLKAPIVGFNSDPFDGHALWAERNMDCLITSSQKSKERLISQGVPAEKVVVIGYPLSLRYTQIQASKEEARAELGLSEDKLTVLHSAGGEGLGGQLEAFVEATLKADLDLQYAVVCGRNEGLYEELVALKERYPNSATQLIPLGFVTNMNTWISASDLVLGKAGAASTFEPLVLGRPIFHTSYAAFNEKTNIDFCIEQGIGAYVDTPQELVKRLRSYVNDPQPLSDLSVKIQALNSSLNTSGSTLEIVKYLHSHYLEAIPKAA